MNFKKAFDFIFYCFIFPLTGISFVLTPLTNDVRIFIGVEYIADKFYQIPYGFDLAWEIKPIGNRIVNWIMYKLASPFASINNPFWFGVSVKVFALIAVIVVSLYFADAVKSQYAFELAVISMTAIGNISVLQAEWWAVLLALVCVGLLLNDRPILVGLLFVGIFLLKGITILMIIPILCAAFILKDKKLPEQFGGMYLGAMIGIGMFSILSIVFWKHTISDMLMSAPVAYIGFVPVTTLIKFAAGGIPFSVAQMPVVAAGIIAAICCIIYRRNIIAMFFLWILPLITIVLQPELMIYHYFLLTIPAIATILAVEELK